MTLSAFLGQLTAARKRLILGILQFILQLINLDKVVLDTVTIGNIHNQKGRNKQKHAYLMSYGLRSQHVTAKDFLKATEPLFKREREKKDMAKLFQALRIEVNHEMDALKEMLQSATELLRSGGRLSVITYHSLEDRIVKNMMKAGNAEGKKVQDFYGRIETPFNLVNNKVIVPSADEQQENPRSRSAKLRIAEKK